MITKKPSVPMEGTTWSELAGIIDSEGFDYFFNHSVGPERFVDQHLKALATTYRDASLKLEEYLIQKGGLYE